MWNLYNVASFLSNSSDSGSGYSDVLIDILSILSILFGISVINSKNPIVSVLFLIGLFISISFNLILLGYNFIGLSYLLVYVGAVSILFLFIIMLINIRISELLNETSNSIPLAVFTGVLIGFPVYQILNEVSLIKEKYLSTDLNYSYNSEEKFENDNSLEIFSDITNYKTYNNLESNKFYPVKWNNDISYVSSNTWEKNLIDCTDITSVGMNLYSTYAIWLIISSIILLLAMIGAITITKTEKD